MEGRGSRVNSILYPVSDDPPMYAFIIHFFEKSIESEYTINVIRHALQDSDMDEFHFLATSNYSDEDWKKKSLKEISASDFVIFLYSRSDMGNVNRFMNVKTELGFAFECHKLVFLIPLDPEDPELSEHLKSISASTPRVDRFDGSDGPVIVTDLNGLVDYMAGVSRMRTSDVPSGSEALERCVSAVEEEYGIVSRNRLSVLYNRMLIESAVREKIVDSMINRDRNDPSALAVQYQTMFNSIENLDERRQTNNTVYTTINTALIALIAATLSIIISNIDTWVGPFFTLAMFVLIPLIGIFICRSWKNDIKRYKDLRSGKFKTLDMLEKYLPMNLNKAEWEILKSRNYVTSSEDAKLPGLMIKMYGILMFVGAVIIAVSLLAIWGVVEI